MIHVERSGAIGLLRMEHGKANAMDTEFLLELSSVLDSLHSSDASAFVITGTGKIFSAGVDLFRVLQGDQKYLESFFRVFSETLEKFFLFPRPIVAAINGHAIAGGCVFACACDFRLMTDGSATIGLPELLVGVPFPTLALEVARSAIAPGHLQEVVYTGRTFPPRQAVNYGLVDELVPAETLLDRAFEIAGKLGEIPEQSFRTVKHQIRSPYVEFAGSHNNDQDVLRIWSDPKIHEVIRAYLQKTIGKK